VAIVAVGCLGIADVGDSAGLLELLEPMSVGAPNMDVLLLNSSNIAMDRE